MFSREIFVLFPQFFHIVFAASDLSIVFWLESSQVFTTENIQRSIQDVHQLNPTVQLNPIIFYVDRDVEDEVYILNKFCQVIASKGVSVVFDLTFYPWDVGLDYVRFHNIAYLPFARILSPFFNMFGDFMEEKNGDDVALLLQNSNDMESALFHIIDGYPFQTLLLHTGEKNFVQRLLDLRPSPIYYAVFANTQNMNEIFEKISKGNLFARPSEWHFIFLDGQHEKFKYEIESEFVTKFTIQSKQICDLLQKNERFCQKDFTFERAVLYSAFSTLIDIATRNEDLLTSRYIQCNDTQSSKLAAINLLPSYVDNKFFGLQNNSKSLFADGSNVAFFLTYNLNVSISIYGSTVTDDLLLAEWKSGSLKKINQTISAGKRFLRIGVTKVVPFSYYKLIEGTEEVEVDENGKPIWDGFCIDLIEILATKLNFDYELVEPKTGTFGERDPNTLKWDGVVGDLVTGNTDLAVTALKIYAEREEVIDYVAPYFDQTGISIIIRNPVVERSLFKFMTVLSWEVWLTVVATVTGTTVMLWFLDKYSPYSARNNTNVYPQSRKFTLQESLWFAVTSFTPQGGGETPKAVSSRVLVAAYWLYVVLMLATFTANLAAFLTMERMNTPVQTMEQLGQQSRINYTVVADSDTHKHFINMKYAEDTLYRMWKELVLNASRDSHKYRVWDYPFKEQYNTILLQITEAGPVKTAADGFQRVQDHESADFAFIHDSSEIKYELTKSCNFSEIGEEFAIQPYALAVQQGSHLADEVTVVLLGLQKERQLEELKFKYWNTTNIKKCPGMEDKHGITLESVGGIFVAAFGGLLIAMLTLALEVLYDKHKQYRKKRTVIQVKPAQIFQPTAVEPLTFRGKQVPETITLGGTEFKPSRWAVPPLQDNILAPNISEGLRVRDKNLPPYLE